MTTIPAQQIPSLPAESLARLQALMAGGQRRLLGLVGAPGAGKSTLAAALLQSVGADRAQVVPMDGFHLANVELQRLGRSGRKGAPDTFDQRTIDALVEPYLNEAEAAVKEGIVADAELADAGLIFGTGFAPFRGGPLHYLKTR